MLPPNPRAHAQWCSQQNTCVVFGHYSTLTAASAQYTRERLPTHLDRIRPVLAHLDSSGTYLMPRLEMTSGDTSPPNQWRLPTHHFHRRIRQLDLRPYSQSQMEIRKFRIDRRKFRSEICSKNFQKRSFGVKRGRVNDGVRRPGPGGIPARMARPPGAGLHAPPRCAPSPCSWPGGPRTSRPPRPRGLRSRPKPRPT